MERLTEVSSSFGLLGWNGLRDLGAYGPPRGGHVRHGLRAAPVRGPPLALLIFLGVIVASDLFLRRTPYGRRVLALGVNTSQVTRSEQRRHGAAAGQRN
ncbi:hypothetical protein AB0I77_52635 [Streptomyces sp. NPDC050619]|uniref:hypothetical protein n=1 Tax=Streptomyces sp. NPDC050619 TaxID=3157214 RepID=UPI003426536C